MFIPAKRLFLNTQIASFCSQAAGDSERLDLGYRQLWLYAMRNYDLMPQPTKNDAELLAKSNRPEVDERVLYEMAELAHRLGFWSDQIRDILEKSPDPHVARAALLRARNPDHFQYDSVEVEMPVDRVVACFSAAAEYIRPSPELLADSEVSARARCGFPQLKAYTQDAPYLLLDKVHDEATFSSATLTTLFVRRCVYFAFFGKRPLSGLTVGDSGPGGRPRGTSSLFVGENVRTARSAPRDPHNVSAGSLIVARPSHEDLQTRQRLEGHTDPIFETRAIGTRTPALEPLYEGSQDDEMPDESSMISRSHNRIGSPRPVGQDGIALIPMDPLRDSQRLSSEWPSTPEERGSENEERGNPERQGEQNAVREYSPSLYSVREVAGDRNNEEQHQYSKDLERAIQERERLDNDWERERLEQEFELPTSTAEYDRDLNSLSPTQCFRAGTLDGRNAVFVFSEEEEKKLGDEGRLKKKVLASISLAGSISIEPERRLK